ncbi:MAG TPA: ACR3 family arsenite efflux transporter [Oscillospiraceae bacterium]|nr:ACR3 family arsenite efflux transporter [Oscillospiraceae bacterium]HRW57523.1 ACR3 family arsenite efflux transporter [Oscillospiraceae bacterium]
MKKNRSSGIGFFEKYLTLWVILCMAAGVLIGRFLPGIPTFLGRFEYANVFIPIAVLIWLMIYPMMLKVDFQSIRNVGKNPKGLFVTWVTNWLIKPFTMFGIAWLFFFVIFKALIPEELARSYLAGAVLLGAAPCTAMVFVWSHLTNGNPAYTVVQVATNDLIILVAFTPIVAFLLGIGGVKIPWDTLILSVVLFVVIPLAGGVFTRSVVIKKRGAEYFNQSFVPKFGNITIAGLLLTLIIIFSFQGDVILNNPLHIVLIAVPLILQTFLIFSIAYLACKALKLPHEIAAPAGMIGASNFFELAVAVAISLFGTTSPAALATIVGVLTEVPVMLILVRIANRTKGWFEPRNESHDEPGMEPQVESGMEPQVEPGTECQVEPGMKSQVEPGMESDADNP